MFVSDKGFNRHLDSVECKVHQNRADGIRARKKHGWPTVCGTMAGARLTVSLYTFSIHDLSALLLHRDHLVLKLDLIIKMIRSLPLFQPIDKAVGSP